MDAWRYGIYLFVFTFDISLVRRAHSFDINVNTRKKIPYLRAPNYNSLFIFFIASRYFLKEIDYNSIETWYMFSIS